MECAKAWKRVSSVARGDLERTFPCRCAHWPRGRCLRQTEAKRSSGWLRRTTSPLRTIGCVNKALLHRVKTFGRPEKMELFGHCHEVPEMP